ncbi:MAG TPA: type VII secretion target [Actinomycetes bacterium]
MSEIEVDPSTLRDVARRLRAAAADASSVRHAAAEASTGVTGSRALTEALRHHAQAWDHSLALIRRHVDDVARSLDEAAVAYDRTETALSGRSGG